MSKFMGSDALKRKGSSGLSRAEKSSPKQIGIGSSRKNELIIRRGKSHVNIF
jgi:hypothetical protein